MNRYDTILERMKFDLECGKSVWETIKSSECQLWNYRNIDRAFTSTQQWGATSYRVLLFGEMEPVYPSSKGTKHFYTLVFLDDGIPVESMQEDLFEGDTLSEFAERVSSLIADKEKLYARSR